MPLKHNFAESIDSISLMVNLDCPWFYPKHGIPIQMQFTFIWNADSETPTPQTQPLKNQKMSLPGTSFSDPYTQEVSKYLGSGSQASTRL